MTIAAAGTLLSMSESSAQTEPASVPTTLPTLDPRIEPIERSRAAPLSPEMREAVLKSILDNERSAEKARSSFTVPDQTEAAVVFTPIPHT